MDYFFKKETNNPQQYYWYQNGLTQEEVERVIKLAAEIPQHIASVGGESKTDNIQDTRSSTVKWIPKSSEWDWLYERMLYLAEDANKALWNFDLISAPEQIQYTEYHASEFGHYNWHQDIMDGEQGSKRKVSITIQLSDSDDYKGGDLEISTGGSTSGELGSNIVCPRGLGVGVLFPSYMMHRVSKVTEGTRKSLVIWVGGSHYR